MQANSIGAIQENNYREWQKLSLLVVAVTSAVALAVIFAHGGQFSSFALGPGLPFLVTSAVIDFAALVAYVVFSVKRCGIKGEDILERPQINHERIQVIIPHTPKQKESVTERKFVNEPITIATSTVAAPPPLNPPHQLSPYNFYKDMVSPLMEQQREIFKAYLYREACWRKRTPQEQQNINDQLDQIINDMQKNIQTLLGIHGDQCNPKMVVERLLHMQFGAEIPNDIALRYPRADIYGALLIQNFGGDPNIYNAHLKQWGQCWALNAQTHLHQLVRAMDKEPNAAHFKGLLDMLLESSEFISDPGRKATIIALLNHFRSKGDQLFPAVKAKLQRLYDTENNVVEFNKSIVALLSACVEADNDAAFYGNVSCQIIENILSLETLHVQLSPAFSKLSLSQILAFLVEKMNEVKMNLINPGELLPLMDDLIVRFFFKINGINESDENIALGKAVLVKEYELNDDRQNKPWVALRLLPKGQKEVDYRQFIENDPLTKEIFNYFEACGGNKEQFIQEFGKEVQELKVAGQTRYAICIPARIHGYSPLTAGGWLFKLFGGFINGGVGNFLFNRVKSDIEKRVEDLLKRLQRYPYLAPFLPYFERIWKQMGTYLLEGVFKKEFHPIMRDGVFAGVIDLLNALQKKAQEKGDQLNFRDLVSIIDVGNRKTLQAINTIKL